MLTRPFRLLIGVALVVALPACGGDAAPTTTRGAAPPAPTAATPAPGGTSPSDQAEETRLDFARGTVPELPVFDSSSGSGTESDDSYRLELTSGDAIRAPLAKNIEPGDLTVLITGTVRAPTELDGRAGVFCRGSADGRSGYELSVDRTGRARLERVDDGRRTLLAGYQARIDAASPPDEPLPIILVCAGRAPEATLGVTVGVKAMTFFDDPDPLPVETSARTGLVVSGGAPANADFAALLLRSEPG